MNKNNIFLAVGQISLAVSILLSHFIAWITSIQFVNENVGWAAGQNGILYTVNGGKKWAYQLANVEGIFVDIYFTDQTHGWAVYFSGDIYKYRAL